jgi:hypothetical protein
VGITKFTSFIVFLFGILLLLVIAASFIMRWIEPSSSGGPKARTVPPACDLPALNVGTKEEFAQKLDSLFDKDGVDGVREFVEKEFIAGRLLIIAPTVSGELPAEMVIIDREVRLCDENGAEQMSVGPVVPRASGTPLMGDDVRLSSWSRVHLSKPLKITTWWVQRP